MMKQITSALVGGLIALSSFGAEMASQAWVNKRIATTTTNLTAQITQAEGRMDAKLAASMATVDTKIATQVGTEATRAKAVEASLGTALTNEQTRAQAAEGALSTELAAEKTRAQAAESTLTSGLTGESQRAQDAETALATGLTTEKTRAQTAEAGLSDDIVTERIRASQAESNALNAVTAEMARAQAVEAAQGATLSAHATAISAEQTRAQAAEGTLNTRVSNAETDIGAAQAAVATINGKIPSAATPTNQLADKAYVSDAVRQYAASFRGSFANWANVPVSDYGYQGGTPERNDYITVQDATDYEATHTGTWLFRYTAQDWTTGGKNGWTPEYRISTSAMTDAQLASLNSGMTATKTAQIDANTTAIADEKTRAETAEAGLSAAIAAASATVPQTASNVVTTVVTKEYVEGLGVAPVYTKDIRATASIGVHKVDAATGYVDLHLAGKNLQEGMEYLTQERKDPGVPTYPRITSVALTGAGEKEVGTTFSPAYAITTADGAYEYGPKPTGATFDQFDVRDTSGHAASSATGTFDAFVVQDETDYRVSVTAHHTAGDYPKDNLGGIVSNEALRIQARWYDRKATQAAATSVSSATVSGYRNWYGYVGTDCTTPIDSAFIRASSNYGNAKVATQKANVTIPAGTKRVMIALPKVNWTKGYKRALTKVIDVDGMGLDIFDRFVKTEVSVAAASASATAMTYSVWTFANPSGISATRFTFVVEEVPMTYGAARREAAGNGYPASVGLNIALNRQFDGPLDVSDVFQSRADLDYYRTKGRLTSGTSAYWLARTPYPFDGQVVALSQTACTPTNYVLKANAVGEFDLVQLQQELVSGQTIKTVNGNSLLGSGNIEIQGGGGGGITTNAVKDIVSSASVTNAGAVAKSKKYADDTFLKKTGGTINGNLDVTGSVIADIVSAQQCVISDGNGAISMYPGDASTPPCLVATSDDGITLGLSRSYSYYAPMIGENALWYGLFNGRNFDYTKDKRIVYNADDAYGSDLFYTKSESDDTFLGKTEKADDSEKLDGHDSSYFATASTLSNYLPLAGGFMSGMLSFVNTPPYRPRSYMAFPTCSNETTYISYAPNVSGLLIGTSFGSVSRMSRLLPDDSDILTKNVGDTLYLPLDGSKSMTGDLELNSDQIIFNNKAEFNNSSAVYDYFEFVSDPGSTTSRLTPDGTSVLTKGLADTLYEPVGGSGPTSGVSKAYVDASVLAATNFVKSNYLPLTGGTMTGDITMGNNSLIFDSLRSISAGPDDSLNFDANYYGFGGPGPIDRSFLTADGTPVVTSNMLNGVLSSYQTNLVVSSATAEKVLSNDGTNLYWKVGGGGGGTPLAGKTYDFATMDDVITAVRDMAVSLGATVNNWPPTPVITGITQDGQPANTAKLAAVSPCTVSGTTLNLATGDQVRIELYAADGTTLLDEGDCTSKVTSSTSDTITLSGFVYNGSQPLSAWVNNPTRTKLVVVRKGVRGVFPVTFVTP